MEMSVDNECSSEMRRVLRYNKGNPEYMPEHELLCGLGKKGQSYKIRWKPIEYVSSGSRASRTLDRREKW